MDNLDYRGEEIRADLPDFGAYLNERYHLPPEMPVKLTLTEGLKSMATRIGKATLLGVPMEHEGQMFLALIQSGKEEIKSLSLAKQLASGGEVTFYVRTDLTIADEEGKVYIPLSTRPKGGTGETEAKPKGFGN